MSWTDVLGQIHPPICPKMNEREMEDLQPRARRRTHWVLRPMKFYLSLRRRWLAMTPNDVVRKRVVWRRVSLLAKMIRTLKGTPVAESEPRLLPALAVLFAQQLSVFRQIVMAPSLLNAKLERIRRKGASIDQFSDEECNLMFRFDNRAQLHRLLVAFQFQPFYRMG